ncbi:hypothetical protein [Herbinix luporum]|jgi:Na+/melibiose symporter-like transporter|uniref:Putative membrane protein n=1 Tax=Herbinix luporum TaxID=1679721 RepID=A0A0K8J859_9FIRM|nr:hypothetical protein [Herbinix luporum]MDI9488012.1 hypothetical protein [Bacillota bacterium]CUH93523.1 putative membrane protein [Herbinix luporum]HHT56160.1 hypothetical protein [Herbinix luporum]
MKKEKGKRVAAIIGIVAILSLYLISLLISIFASDKYPGLFMASVFLTVIIPIMIYCLVAVYKRVHRKNDDTDESNNI